MGTHRESGKSRSGCLPRWKRFGWLEARRGQLTEPCIPLIALTRLAAVGVRAPASTALRAPVTRQRLCRSWASRARRTRAGVPGTSLWAWPTRTAAHCTAPVFAARTDRLAGVARRAGWVPAAPARAALALLAGVTALRAARWAARTRVAHLTPSRGIGVHWRLAGPSGAGSSRRGARALVAVVPGIPGDTDGVIMIAIATRSADSVCGAAIVATAAVVATAATAACADDHQPRHNRCSSTHPVSVRRPRTSRREFAAPWIRMSSPTGALGLIHSQWSQSSGRAARIRGNVAVSRAAKPRVIR